ncbi:hypothetical protein SCALM49S_00040 [Streptomyces californicus]
MFTIGDFARYGRVSPRMLRHYDAVGLLHPDRTDPATGYRLYGAAQLARLNRIIALKDLGFTLQQVAAVLDEQVGPEELRGMLRFAPGRAGGGDGRRGDAAGRGRGEAPVDRERGAHACRRRRDQDRSGWSGWPS